MAGWRELTDEQLEELKAASDLRVTALLQTGVQISGLAEHYIVALLEEIAGPRGTMAAQESHFLWLRDRLDEAEPQIREARARAILTEGVAMNGQGHAPNRQQRRHPS